MLSMAATSSRPEGGGSGLQVAGAREFLLPITVLVCFVLYYLLEAPGWVVAVIAIPAVALYAIAPAWAERSVISFDRDFVRLLSTQRRGALPGRYARAVGMRLFANPILRAERHALVAAENGHHGQARASYRVALNGHGNGAPLRVRLGYAHACHAIADDIEAIRVYRDLLSQVGTLPSVRRNLAHSLVRHGTALREAIALIDGEGGSGGGSGRPLDPELVLMRALAHAKLGEGECARELMAAVEHATGELALSLRRDLERALEGSSEVRPA